MILILRMVLEKLYKEGMSVSFSTQQFCFLCYCFQRAQNCLTLPAPSTFDPIMYVRRRLLYATCTSPIMHLICPPKFCITFVFYFSWVLQPSQEKLKTQLASRRLEVVGKRKNWAREGDTRGKRERLPEEPMKIVSTRFPRVRKFRVG